MRTFYSCIRIEKILRAKTKEGIPTLLRIDTKSRLFFSLLSFTYTNKEGTRALVFNQCTTLKYEEDFKQPLSLAFSVP